MPLSGTEQVAAVRAHAKAHDVPALVDDVLEITADGPRNWRVRMATSG